MVRKNMELNITGDTLYMNIYTHIYSITNTNNKYTYLCSKQSCKIKDIKIKIV